MFECFERRPRCTRWRWEQGKAAALPHQIWRSIARRRPMEPRPSFARVDGHRESLGLAERVLPGGGYFSCICTPIIYNSIHLYNEVEWP